MRVLIVLVTGAVLGVVVCAILAFHGSSSVSLAGEAYAPGTGYVLTGERPQ